MKKTARIIALLIAFLMVLGIFASVFSMSRAVSYDQGVYAYGAGLSESDIEKTAKLLNIQDFKNIKKTKVTSEDLYRFVLESSNDASMISSVYVKKTEENTGVKVVITTPENITQISERQYENAAITAGISDATIYVAAIRPVTGTSALTGVYKAFELNGQELDQKSMITANEEIETVNAIVQEHKDDKGFSTDKIADVVVYVKDSIFNINKNDGKKASDEDIRKYIQEALEKYDLKNVINQVNIDRLVVFFQQFQDSPAAKSDKVKEQLSILGEQLKDLSSQYVNQAKDFINSDEGRSFFQKIGDFFSGILQEIVNIFK